MSSISSNTIGSYYDPEQQQQENITLPIEIPYQLKNVFDQQVKQQKNIKESAFRKFKWFTHYLLKNYKYKAGLKQVNQRVLKVNEYKAIHGSKNCKKQTVKMKILLKHGSTQQCQQGLANIIIQTLLGQQTSND